MANLELKNLEPETRSFIEAGRVARLATADAAGAPHVLPVCYAVADSALYIAIDQKPKSGDPRRLKRLRNIAENAQVAVVVDRYETDWTRLGWVMVRGRAEIVEAGAEHAQAVALLRARYPQYQVMQLEHLPVIGIRISKVTHWGDLSVSEARVSE